MDLMTFDTVTEFTPEEWEEITNISPETDAEFYGGKGDDDEDA